MTRNLNYKLEKLNMFKRKKTEDHLAVLRNADARLTFSMTTEKKVLKE